MIIIVVLAIHFNHQYTVAIFFFKITLVAKIIQMKWNRTFSSTEISLLIQYSFINCNLINTDLVVVKPMTMNYILLIAFILSVFLWLFSVSVSDVFIILIMRWKSMLNHFEREKKIHLKVMKGVYHRHTHTWRTSTSTAHSSTIGSCRLSKLEFQFF